MDSMIAYADINFDEEMVPKIDRWNIKRNRQVLVKNLDTIGLPSYCDHVELSNGKQLRCSNRVSGQKPYCIEHLTEAKPIKIITDTINEVVGSNDENI